MDLLFDFDRPDETLSKLSEMLRSYEDEIRIRYDSIAGLSEYEAKACISCSGEQYEFMSGLTNRIKEIINDSILTGWHFTRLEDPASVEHQGLVAPTERQSIDRVRHFCDLVGMKRREKSESTQRASFFLERDKNRRGTVHFFSRRDLGKKYMQYTEAVGGELVVWCIAPGREGSYYDRLCAIGKPCAIKFCYPFKDVEPASAEKCILEIARSYIINILMGRYAPIYFDAYLTRSVPSSNIVLTEDLSPLATCTWLGMSRQIENESYEGPLPKHTRIDYWEAWAREILFELDNETYGNLAIVDKPDLQDTELSVGVEVVSAIAENSRKADGLFDSLQTEADFNKRERYKGIIEEAGAHYIGGVMHGPNGRDSFDGILEAVKDKLDKLNGGGYETFHHEHLFVRSEILADARMLAEALESIVELSGRYERRFERIVVWVPSYLYIFEVNDRRYWVSGFDSIRQIRCGEAARQAVIKAETASDCLKNKAYQESQDKARLL